MQLDTIGKNIRKYRLMKKFRQEDLAEKAGLTTNYIGMETGYTVKNSILNEKLAKLAPEDRSKIYEVIDTLLKHSKKIAP